jgi:hypothetical protein
MMNVHDPANFAHMHSRCHRGAGHIARHIALAVLLGAAFVVLFGFGVMYLWNAVMPALFGVAHITFWRAVGVLLLARILVGGFHRGHFAGRRFGRRDGWRQYEEWWRQVGEQSYREFSTARPTDSK